MNRCSSLILAIGIVFILNSMVFAQGYDSSNVIKEGLLGAGTGAIAAGTSGGSAGKGALIGAGTNVIGGALLDVLTGSNKRQSRDTSYSQDDEYYEYEEEPEPSSSGASKIIGQGLVGAGTGAIAAGTSGGSAGKGALIGAGTNVIGNALLDTLTGSEKKSVKKRPIKRQPPPPTQGQVQEEKTPSKKIIRKYDEKGNLVSEEEIYP